MGSLTQAVLNIWMFLYLFDRRLTLITAGSGGTQSASASVVALKYTVFLSEQTLDYALGNVQALRMFTQRR